MSVCVNVWDLVDKFRDLQKMGFLNIGFLVPPPPFIFVPLYPSLVAALGPLASLAAALGPLAYSSRSARPPSL